MGNVTEIKFQYFEPLEKRTSDHTGVWGGRERKVDAGGPWGRGGASRGGGAPVTGGGVVVVVVVGG
jgi:hypothetical protein